MARPEQIETRDRFLVFDTLTTRWKDNDNWGHVNNAVYNSWIDTAITSHLWSILPDFGASQIIPVAAETRVIFHAPVCHPASIVTGLRVEHLGNSSMRCSVGIFEGTQTTASAWGHMVHVWIDRLTNQSVRIPDSIRDGLTQVMLPVK